jgi:hypothetical protein
MKKDDISKPDGVGIPGQKRRLTVLFIIPLFFGLMGFFRVAESPQFESYRTLHVIQLLMSGACIGGAFVGFLLKLVHGRS